MISKGHHMLNNLSNQFDVIFCDSCSRLDSCYLKQPIYSRGKLKSGEKIYSSLTSETLICSSKMVVIWTVPAARPLISVYYNSNCGDSQMNYSAAIITSELPPLPYTCNYGYRTLTHLCLMAD